LLVPKTMGPRSDNRGYGSRAEQQSGHSRRGSPQPLAVACPVLPPQGPSAQRKQEQAGLPDEIAREQLLPALLDREPKRRESHQRRDNAEPQSRPVPLAQKQDPAHKEQGVGRPRDAQRRYPAEQKCFPARQSAQPEGRAGVPALIGLDSRGKESDGVKRPD